MKCRCNAPCDILQDLTEAEDQWYYLMYDCLPDQMENNYPRLAKDTLRCCLCYMDHIREAVACKRLCLSDKKLERLELMWQTTNYYYNTFNTHHPKR